MNISIECTNSPDERFGAVHQITLHDDWRVETAHDLEAERVGHSLGGWCSCLHFVERIVPIYREALHVMSDPGQLPHNGRGWGNIYTDIAHTDGWRELEYSRFPHAHLGDALRQEISPQHLLATTVNNSDPSPALVALEHGMYSELFARAGQVWSESADPRQIDGGADSFYALWREGLTPTSISEVARAIPKSAWPLHPDFYRRACLDTQGSWLCNVVSCFPTREFAKWAVAADLVWDRATFSIVWGMQELDLSASDAIGALDAGVPLQALNELACRPGVGGPTAARWLTIWSRLSVTPTSEHYRLLEACRALTALPPRWVLDSTESTVQQLTREAPPRVELAVMLALTNSTKTIEHAIRAGIRTATDVKFMEIVHTGRTN